MALTELRKDDLALIIGTTPFPWTVNGRPRKFQFRAVEDLIGKLRHRPLILAGDFNEPRGGSIFQLLADAWRDCIPQTEQTSKDPELQRAGPLELLVDGLLQPITTVPEVSSFTRA